jgi:hypothetical protein
VFEVFTDELERLDVREGVGPAVPSWIVLVELPERELDRGVTTGFRWCPLGMVR